MNQVIGVESRYIAADDNRCADAVSRISKDSLFSISNLFQDYPKLSTYRRYHPASKLVSLIYKALMNDLQ